MTAPREDEARRESREFLEAFLAALGELDQSNRTLATVITQQTQIQSQQTQAMAQIQVQLASRIEVLERQIERLCSFLNEDEDPLPRVQRPQRGPGPMNPFPSVGQAVGGVIGWGFDAYLRNGGRRQRP